MDSPLVIGLAGAAAGGLLATALCAPGGPAAALPPRGANVPGKPVDTEGVFAKGNTAVITGAGSGIGLATAKRCGEGPLPPPPPPSAHSYP